MAFDFVQLDTSLPTSIPVRLAAGFLGLEPRGVLGMLWELTQWAVQALPTGRFTPSSASGGRPDDVRAEELAWSQALEHAVHWTGEPGAVWSALLRAGLLVRERDGVRLTTSDRYVQVLEKRAREAARKREARARARGSASAGRPPDVRPKKRREEDEDERVSTAAGHGLGASGGRPRPVPPPPPVEASADAPPVQRALPGAHLVRASPPREERRQDALGGAVAAPPGAGAPPSPQRGAAGPAEAFFERCIEARRAAHPHLPAVPMPRGWPKWYADALADPAVKGDESRLFLGWEEYLRARYPAEEFEPPYPADAFTSPKVWSRYVGVVQTKTVVGEEPELAAVDTSTPAGRAWQEYLDELTRREKRYARQQLQPVVVPVDLVDRELVLRCPDEHFREWVIANCGDLLASVSTELGYWGVRWVVAEQPSAASA